MTRSVEWGSMAALSLPDLPEVSRAKLRKNIPNASKMQRMPRMANSLQNQASLSQSSLLSKIDKATSHPSIHPMVSMSIKVFILSIIYHLVEEKTSKSIKDFNFSWFITFVELASAFSLELIERVSINISILRKRNQKFSFRTLFSASASLSPREDSDDSQVSTNNDNSHNMNSHNNSNATVAINVSGSNSNTSIEQSGVTDATARNPTTITNQQVDGDSLLLRNDFNDIINDSRTSNRFENDESYGADDSGSDNDDETTSFIKHKSTSNGADTRGTNPSVAMAERMTIDYENNDRAEVGNVRSEGLVCRWIPRDKYPLSYILLALNLVLSRGLSTVVLQYYDMDYPTYAICRNTKMVFVMILSVFWLKKTYKITDWVLVLLISLSVLCFRVASHDVLTSKVNTIGVPILLVAIFLGAMDNSWKEKVMRQRHDATPNEILFHINLIAVMLLFFGTLISGESFLACQFLVAHPTTILWMCLRGVSYAFWIHFSVVLIQQAGALVNQYVSAARKLFSVILSFVIFAKPFYWMHGIGFVLFAMACVLKVFSAHQRSAHRKHHESSSISMSSSGSSTETTVNSSNGSVNKHISISKTAHHHQQHQHHPSHQTSQQHNQHGGNKDGKKSTKNSKNSKNSGFSINNMYLGRSKEHESSESLSNSSDMADKDAMTDSGTNKGIRLSNGLGSSESDARGVDDDLLVMPSVNQKTKRMHVSSSHSPKHLRNSYSKHYYKNKKQGHTHTHTLAQALAKPQNRHYTIHVTNDLGLMPSSTDVDTLSGTSNGSNSSMTSISCHSGKDGNDKANSNNSSYHSVESHQRSMSLPTQTAMMKKVGHGHHSVNYSHNNKNHSRSFDSGLNVNNLLSVNF